MGLIKRSAYTGVIAIVLVAGYNLFVIADTKQTINTNTTEIEPNQDVYVEEPIIEEVPQGEVHAQVYPVEPFVYSEEELRAMESTRDPFSIQKEVEKHASDLLAEYQKQQEQLEKVDMEEQPTDLVDDLETPQEATEDLPLLDNIITTEAEKYGIDRNWITVIIENESKYDPKAINENLDDSGVVKSIDRGLMQINSKTAPWLARKLGLDYIEGMEFDEPTNIAMGTFYLNYLKGISPDLDFIFTAYNRGPSGANTYKQKNGTYETTYSKAIKQALLLE